MQLRSYLVALALAALAPVAMLAAVVGSFLLDEQREQQILYAARTAVSTT